MTRVCVCVCVCVHAYCMLCLYLCARVLTDLSTTAIADSKDIEIVLSWWNDHRKKDLVSNTNDSSIKTSWAILICELKARIIGNT